MTMHADIGAPAPTPRVRARRAGYGKPVTKRHPSPAFTDADLAEDFAQTVEDEFRYVAEWGKWLHFYEDKGVWRREPTHLIRERSRRYSQDRASECQEPKDKVRIASGKTIASVLTLSQADRHLAATSDQWDRDSMVLNTPGGTVNLATGDIHAHRRQDYLTKSTTVSPGDGDCPLWMAFLHHTFAGDADLIAFVQRMCGYCLTGSTKEQALFFGYGTGGNGKSVLLGTLAGILGDYHTTAPMDTFTAAAGNRHPTDLARLQGARLVTAVETEAGNPWAESKIKTLTGGDRVAARFMCRDFFEFTPQFKLFIVGNHRPSLRTVDEAMRRRFNMVPFNVTVQKDERDLELKEKIEAEWPSILQWMIDGCLEWQERGLQPPAAVTAATEDYLEQEDILAAWLTERCYTGKSHKAKASVLFADWKRYAEAAGEPAGSLKSFAPKLEARGFPRKREKDGRYYLGLDAMSRASGEQ